VRALHDKMRRLPGRIERRLPEHEPLRRGRREDESSAGKRHPDLMNLAYPVA
jgi:hypothetical protein